MNRCLLMLATAAVISGLVPSGQANAATDNKSHYQAGTGFCQGALASFDTGLRRRPTAIANEGTELAFVSCSARKQYNDSVLNSDNEPRYSLIIYNRNAGAVNVSCSLVNSYQGGSTAVIPKALTVPGNARAFFTWDAVADNGGVEFDYPNFSCGLPPGTEIGYILYNYDDEIGS